MDNIWDYRMWTTYEITGCGKHMGSTDMDNNC